MSELVYIILTLLLFVIISVIAVVWLFKSQKKNRQFEKKGVWIYALVSFLVFFLLGAVGFLISGDFSVYFLISQAIIIVLGIIHIWVLFSNYEWSDRASYLSESLFTIFIMCVGILALISSAWIFSHVMGGGESYILTAYKYAFWFIVPYMMLRTYDLMMEIPRRIFNAWYFPTSKPLSLDFNTANVIYVYWNLDLDGKGEPEKMILDKRARLPKDALLEDCFQNFVRDYNQKNTSFPIINLHENEQQQAIGWLFYVKKQKRGRKTFVKPEEVAFGNILEGDLITAKRVPINKNTIPKTKPTYYNPEDDGLGGIVITEK